MIKQEHYKMAKIIIRKESKEWNLKYGDEVKIISVDEHCAPKETVGSIGTIACIDLMSRDYRVNLNNGESWFYCEGELKSVEEENTEVNQDVTVEEFLKQQIEDLKTQLKDKQSRIDYLEGQVSVYEKYMFD